MTTAKNDVLLGYTLVGGGGGIDFCWGDKNLVRGRESTGGFFQISGGPYCRENIASGIWQIGWTCSGMAENDKVLQNDQ